jgi:ribokinase
MHAPRIAVVGHVEWVTFAHGEVPGRGEIVVLDDGFDRPAGGGAMAAIELARLGADTVFLTALGDDEAAGRCRRSLEGSGIEVRAGHRAAPQTRVLTVLDAAGERTILVVGPILQPRLDDDLGWSGLGSFDAVYFTGGDVPTLVAARRAPLLVVTARRLATLAASGVRVDVLVCSARDPDEQPADHPALVEPGVTIATAGADGGTWRAAEGRAGAWAAAELPGPVHDAYGAGDCFNAGVTFGLALGEDLDRAIERGAAGGADAVTRHGPLRGG